MNIDNINTLDLENRLRQILKPQRYKHTLGVAYTAASLAMKYSENIKKAYVCGLLHDCAKYLSPEELLKTAEDNNLDISVCERKKPDLLHSKVGAFFARKVYEIEDDDILEAIIYHTTGKPEMNMLQKIIFISDYIEPSRYKMNRLNEIRKIAFEDIDKALYMILEDTLEYLNKTMEVVDPMTEKTFLYYKDKKNDN